MTKEVKYYFGIPFEVRGSAAAPAEAEPKFKVGDRVRFTDAVNDKNWFFKAGDTGTITDDGWYFKPDEIELLPTFTPGDRVRLTRNAAGFMVGDVGTVNKVESDWIGVSMDYRNVFRIFAPGELAADCPQDNAQLRDPKDTLSAFTVIADKFFVKRPTNPAIVALVKNGQPRPADLPYVHASVSAATTEAERLAKNNPGQEFAVYQRVAGRVTEVSYEMKEVA